MMMRRGRREPSILEVTLRGFAFATVLACTLAASAAAHPNVGHERKIAFPDVGEYTTLVVDLHTHSVFSDGSVWPTVRVEEARRDGLDALAITEHLEYQPHSDDIPHRDRNRAYELAKEAAKYSDLLIIHGSEITRDMPPGHANAVFLENSNRLLRDDAMAVFKEADKQGAFTFWNHPNWVGQRDDATARLEDMHLELIEKGWLHGIEVTNDLTYSDEALAIAIEHDLTIIGTSDIHGLVDWQYEVPEGGHRPVTLVFSEQRSEEGLEQALRAGRTVAWMGDLLVGLEENLVPLLEQSLQVSSAKYWREQLVRVTLRNDSSARLTLRRVGGAGFYSGGPVIEFAPLAETYFELPVEVGATTVTVEFEVMSALIAPRTHPKLSMEIAIPTGD